TSKAGLWFGSIPIKTPSLCSLCVLCVSVVSVCWENNHRGTENTEVAQRNPGSSAVRQANCTRLGRMVYEMIRITCHSESSLTRVVLEGKLAGACVDELEKCWRGATASWSTLLVDLTSVSFIDERGKQLLKT